MYYRVLQCEIGKIDLSIIDFSCPSSMCHSQGGEFTETRVWARFYVASLRNRDSVALKPESANRGKSRGSGTKRPSSRPTRVPHAMVPSSLGPARKHPAKFEPDSWSWAQTTSGLGPPKRSLSEEPHAHPTFRGQIEYLDRRLNLKKQK